jgi:hypothetical protein
LHLSVRYEGFSQEGGKYSQSKSVDLESQREAAEYELTEINYFQFG